MEPKYDQRGKNTSQWVVFPHASKHGEWRKRLVLASADTSLRNRIIEANKEQCQVDKKSVTKTATLMYIYQVAAMYKGHCLIQTLAKRLNSIKKDQLIKDDTKTLAAYKIPSRVNLVNCHDSNCFCLVFGNRK